MEHVCRICLFGLVFVRFAVRACVPLSVIIRTIVGSRAALAAVCNRGSVGGAVAGVTPDAAPRAAC